jgi:16S rRNA (cytidine1402-2'-O)-methyltransferase
VPGTLVFFESPRRIAETLADAAAVLGPRAAAIARELTKLYETVRRGPLDALAATLAAEETPKGEIVLLIAPPEAGAAEQSEADLDARLMEALAAYSLKDAASVVAAATGQPRRQVYARALQLTAGRDKGDSGK